MKTRKNASTNVEAVDRAVRESMPNPAMSSPPIMTRDNSINLPQGLRGNDRIIRLPEVMQTIGIRGKSTIYRWVKNQEFPAPLSLGGSSVGWRESDVQAWMASRPSVTLPTQAQ